MLNIVRRIRGANIWKPQRGITIPKLQNKIMLKGLLANFQIDIQRGRIAFKPLTFDWAKTMDLKTYKIALFLRDLWIYAAEKRKVV